jgi:hypothetical protein
MYEGGFLKDGIFFQLGFVQIHTLATKNGKRPDKGGEKPHTQQ